MKPTNPDSDLRREVEGRMEECADKMTDRHGHEWFATSVHNAVSVAVEGIKAERERYKKGLAEIAYGLLKRNWKQVSIGLNSTIRNPPTEPPRDFADMLSPVLEMQGAKPDRTVQATVGKTVESPPFDYEECGCGTTGCTECLPREERCPTCKGPKDELRVITEGEFAYLCTDWYHPSCRPQKVTPCAYYQSIGTGVCGRCHEPRDRHET